MDLAAKDYEARRMKGDLVYLKKSQQKAFQNDPVPLTYSADGLIRSGDHLQLAIEHNQGDSKGLGVGRFVLACNVFTETLPGQVKVTAAKANFTVTGDPEPHARDVLVIQKAHSLRSGGGRNAAAALAHTSHVGLSASGRLHTAEDDIIRYGDRVILASNPILTADPSTNTVGLQYLLHSDRFQTKKGKQEVTMTTARGSQTEWAIAAADGDRVAMEGHPVRLSDPIILVHCMSNSALSASPGDYQTTDFGVELDTTCLTHKRAAHVSMNEEGDVSIQNALPPNRWFFVGSNDASAGHDDRTFHALTPDALSEKATRLIARHAGLHGIRSLSLAFSALDQKATGMLPAEIVRAAMVEHGATLTPDEYTLMFAPFIDRKNFIPTMDLLDKLRCNALLSRVRRQAVSDAFDALTAATARKAANPPKPAPPGHGTVNLSSLTPTIVLGATGLPTFGAAKVLYDSKFDPRVREGLLTAVEASNEFSRQWPKHHNSTNEITFEDFASYYEDVAPCVSGGLATDDEFVELVANTWHIPGQGCWKLKKSKKVLVTFHKGTTAEAVVPEAEDIPDDDFEGLSKLLKKQGFGGIARIKVLELIDND